jgi:hypothetical protein
VSFIASDWSSFLLSLSPVLQGPAFWATVVDVSENWVRLGDFSSSGLASKGLFRAGASFIVRLRPALVMGFGATRPRPRPIGVSSASVANILISGTARRAVVYPALLREDCLVLSRERACSDKDVLDLSGGCGQVKLSPNLPFFVASREDWPQLRPLPFGSRIEDRRGL